MLRITSISKSYSKSRGVALDGVSLELNPGEVVGLVGLNGAGKTTTLRIACGVTLPDDGQVEVDGIGLRERKVAASRLLGWVPEQPAQDPSSRVESLIRYYSDIVGVGADKTAEALLKTWGLKEHSRARFRELSLGLKRRLAIVAASLANPRYFLLDEPFNGLDPAVMVRFRRWILELRDEGRGVLLASHNLREVQSLCDRVVVIHHGRIVASVTASEITSATRSDVTLVLDRIDASSEAILSRFGEVSISGNAATVRGKSIDPGEVTTSLVREGYVVRRLSSDESNLEEYFLSLVGEDS
jgi:ABC-2 type transport system ATP-binding protein